MKLSNEEVDDLIKKVSPESFQSGVINYRDIIEQFVSDYDQVNIINSNINDADVEKPTNALDVPQNDEWILPPMISVLPTESKVENSDTAQSRLIASSLFLAILSKIHKNYLSSWLKLLKYNRTTINI